ncbi:SusC/RagA family TonB-linked outer membrane protein [Pedobacter rhizosphaerae]|uniref:TonB-linked outer membrane protein, SusC/RagA family n=1 Tax=Pedobacter rhizosphaerae TaxID=390241 RepID=A0A1H9VSV8_9SPHI|nr:SusC/RagA family TonB-linked outer membrane protein [Pedobacter rhizosphaerae]SES24363.1 TonB-linked outer membrane protein, SusC/RagA family [Pedobacter rhizosphaerae]
MNTSHTRAKRSFTRRLFLAISLTLMVFALTNNASAQKVYTLSFKNASLETVITSVADKTGYQFVYDAAYAQKFKALTAEISTADINQILNRIFKDQAFTYKVTGKTILLTPAATSAQSFTIHGMVNDATGIYLPGATVRQKGTNKIVNVDRNGHFAITVDEDNSILQFNYIGYEPKEVKYTKSVTASVVVVTLQSTPGILSEVVVTGYQNIAKPYTPAAAVVIDSTVLNSQVNNSLLSALEGRVAGLLYTKNPTGTTADQPVLRGIATISADVQAGPLVVIDGLPTDIALENINPYDVESVTVLKDAAAASIYGARAANGIIVITTKKGKGNLRVTLNSDFFIGTKPNLDAMHYASTSDVIDYEQSVYDRERAKYANTTTMFNAYGDIANGTIKYYSPLYQLNRDLSEGKITSQQFNNTVNQWRGNDYIADYRNNVWQNEFRQRYNLSFSGGNDKQNSYLSFNYDDNRARIKYNQDQNYNLYYKSNFKINKWLSASVGLNGTYNISNTTDIDFNNYTSQARYERITDGNGNLVTSLFANIDDGFTSGGAMNPVVAAKINGTASLKPVSFNILESLQEGLQKQKTLGLRAFANLEAKIYDGLTFGTQVQFETSRAELETYNDVNSYKMRYAFNALAGYTAATNLYASGLPIGGRFYQINQQRQNYTFRNQLNYNKSFHGSDHVVSAIAGFEMRETLLPRALQDLRYGYDPVTLTSTVINSASLSQTGVPSYIYGGNRTLAALSRIQTEEKHRYFSVYSNFNYTYKSKYNLSGSIRIDRADLFGVDPKFKNRPLWSGGFGWNISNEEFMKSVEWVDVLKFRATYGIGGNIDQGSSPYIKALRRNDNLIQNLQYITISAQPNPLLRWEKTATTNLGLDFGVLKNRLRGSIDAYDRYSTDLFSTTDLDPTVGALSRKLNNGALRNQGIEFSLSSDWLHKGDLTLSSTFILGFNKNRVKKVNVANSTAGSYVGSPTNYYLENTAFNSLYAYRYGGMVNGYPYILDENGNPSITFDSNGSPVPTSVRSINSIDAIVNMGSLTPTYTGSFSQRVSYKQFDLNLLFVFSGGNKMRKDVINIGSYDVNDLDITQRYVNGITPDQPRLLVDYAVNMENYATTINSQWRNSDVNVVDADYVKLRNISLGYSLPKSFANKIHISAAKLTFQMNNIWYWSAAGDDIDPEVYSLNSATRNLPLPKTYLFGLNLTL